MVMIGKYFSHGRSLAAVGLLALGGCLSGTNTSFTPPSAGAKVRAELNSPYQVLYSFRGRHGASPYAAPINVAGTLYGTTSHGGTYDAGMFYKITPSGKEVVLRSFFGVRGALPLANLIEVKGTLYGTTELGGTGAGCSGSRCGTVFSITTSGVEHVLHNFSGPDGAEPLAPLLDVNGIFYGTTIAGGASDLGTVFSLTRSGKETVLHSFSGGSDGAHPRAGLIEVNNKLYGTSQDGGANSCGGFGCGTVYAITTSGKETVLHSFSGSDGSSPTGNFAEIKGALYSTTDSGGANCGGSGGCGTVFRITTSGKETVIHSFSGADGAFPYAGLISVKGILYGTTVNGGGGGSACDYAGCGTIFSIMTSGKETVLHSFGNYGDGINPFAGLLNGNGMIYGTTPYAGVRGFGTAFSLKY